MFWPVFIELFCIRNQKQNKNNKKKKKNERISKLTINLIAHKIIDDFVQFKRIILNWIAYDLLYVCDGVNVIVFSMFDGWTRKHENGF